MLLVFGHLMQISYILLYLRLVLKSLEVWSKRYFLYELGCLPLFFSSLSSNPLIKYCSPSFYILPVSEDTSSPPSLSQQSLPPSLAPSFTLRPELLVSTLYLDRSLDVRMLPCRLAALLGLLVLCKGKNDSNTSADVYKKIRKLSSLLTAPLRREGLILQQTDKNNCVYFK